MLERGTFYTIEGIDGIGKSTVIRSLKAIFDPKTLYLTKEPGDISIGSSVGKGIRELLFTYPTANKMAPGVADLLFLADHMQNSYEIELMLSTGFTVVSDRYADSQFAYAASKSKQSPPWTLDLYQQQYGVVPDLILFMRALNSYTGWTLKRAKARLGIEAGKQEGKPWNDIEAQLAIQRSYEQRFKGQDNVVIINIDETDTPEQVSSKVIHVVQEFQANKAGYGAGV